MSDQIVQNQDIDRQPFSGMKLLRIAVTAAGFCICLLLIPVFCYNFILSSGTKEAVSQEKAADASFMDKYDMYITNAISDALDGVLSVDKVYWLSDSDQVAPEPNPACYGEAHSYEEMVPILKKAEKLLDGQTLAFTPDRPVWDGHPIRYYYDETILVITWKEIINECVFTVSEVKIAHPSQLRRFLAGGEFGADKYYVTTEMAASVNAVMASSGDFYSYRRHGVVVYDGELCRFESKVLDSCYINEDGDLLVTYRNELETEEEAKKFIEENNIRFSLVFGPVLIENSEVVVPVSYPLGEINDEYSRAALCQRDQLHYLLVNTSQEGSYWRRFPIRVVAEFIQELGCKTAYALDGGQTTAFVMNDELVTNPDFNNQRMISDIIYFATALPDGG